MFNSIIQLHNYTVAVIITNATTNAMNDDDATLNAS